MSLLSTIIAAAGLNVHTNFGVAEQLPTNNGLRPMVRVGGADLKSVLEDFNHSLTYIRYTGPIRVGSANGLVGCDTTERRTYPLRIVVLAQRTDDLCADLTGALLSAQSAIANADLVGTTGADSIDMVSSTVDGDSFRVAASEAPGFDLKLQWAIGYIDLTIEVIGEPACFDNCFGGYTPPTPAGECPYDIVIMLDGVQVGTAGPFDPCVANTLNIIMA